MTSKNSLFTQKHYEFMTARLQSYAVSSRIKCEVAAALCDIFESDNPKFKRQMFLQGALTPAQKETTND